MKNFFEKILTKNVLIASLVISVAFLGYGVREYSILRKDNIALTSRVIGLNRTIDFMESGLTRAEIEKLDLTDNLLSEKERAEALGEKAESLGVKVEDLTGTVGTLEKLAATDPELLQKYSKVFFLNEHYDPPELSEVTKGYTYDVEKAQKVRKEVWPYLEELLDDAWGDNLNLFVTSSYRSFGEQASLKSNYTVIYGAGTANQFSADQGYSEHQLGTTIDFTTLGYVGSLRGFENSPEYQWLINNAHKYGFVLSYPQGNAYYIFEPWHWRFVGVDLATDLHKNGKHFYNLSQREIDEYLISIFD